MALPRPPCPSGTEPREFIPSPRRRRRYYSVLYSLRRPAPAVHGPAPSIAQDAPWHPEPELGRATPTPSPISSPAQTETAVHGLPRFPVRRPNRARYGASRPAVHNRELLYILGTSSWARRIAARDQVPDLPSLTAADPAAKDQPFPASGSSDSWPPSLAIPDHPPPKLSRPPGQQRGHDPLDSVLH